MFGGVNAVQQLRLIFAELGASSIPSSFVVPKVHKVFDQNANLLDDTYDKRIIKFLEEFEWYIEALKNQSKRYSILRNKKRS
jgi:NAD(P)H-dependent FMN reductase